MKTVLHTCIYTYMYQACTWTIRCAQSKHVHVHVHTWIHATSQNFSCITSQFSILPCKRDKAGVGKGIHVGERLPCCLLPVVGAPSPRDSSEQLLSSLESAEYPAHKEHTVHNNVEM